MDDYTTANEVAAEEGWDAPDAATEARYALEDEARTPGPVPDAPSPYWRARREAITVKATDAIVGRGHCRLCGSLIGNYHQEVCQAALEALEATLLARSEAALPRMPATLEECTASRLHGAMLAARVFHLHRPSPVAPNNRECSCPPEEGHDHAPMAR
jgi:hypothetical protein